MRLITLDAALGRCAVAIVDDGRVLAERFEPGGRGQSALLAPMLGAVLEMAGLRPEMLDGIAVTIGPGSFTGLRTALSLAHGVAAAAKLRVAGVTVAEALAEAVPMSEGRLLWVAIESRRDWIFLHRDGAIGSVALEALPASGRVAVAGDAAVAVADRLATRGTEVWLTDARLPGMLEVAAIGARRLRGEIAWLEAQPLYVDPPQASLPTAGLRPPPR